VPQLFQPAAEAIQHLWARSTWETRAYLWRRVAEFARRERIEDLPLGMQAVAMIANLPNVTNATRLTYASSIRGIARRLELQTPLLNVYASSLAAAGGGIPTQAVPATAEQVKLLIEATMPRSPNIAVAIYLAYKTASRWDDIRHLQRRALLEFDPKRRQIVLEWGSLKTNRNNRWFTVHGWTVVQEDRFPEMLRLAVETFSALPTPESHLCELTTPQLVRLIQRHPQCKELTAHSFKRGAADVLWRAAAERRLDVRLLPLLLKHKDALHDFPNSSLRYGPNTRTVRPSW
jgi:hypothetical protein